MVALADTALDLCVLELGLLLRFVALVFAAGFPVGYGAEGNVLGDRDRVCLRAWGLALFLSEFSPLLSLGYAGVDDLLDDCLLDAPCGLVLLAVFDAVRDDCFGSVFVLDDLWGWEGGERGLLVFFFRPVGAAVRFLSARRSLPRTDAWRSCCSGVRHGRAVRVYRQGKVRIDSPCRFGHVCGCGCVVVNVGFGGSRGPSEAVESEKWRRPVGQFNVCGAPRFRANRCCDSSPFINFIVRSTKFMGLSRRCVIVFFIIQRNVFDEGRVSHHHQGICAASHSLRIQSESHNGPNDWSC
jgi:hypothetical protein